MRNGEIMTEREEEKRIQRRKCRLEWREMRNVKRSELKNMEL